MEAFNETVIRHVVVDTEDGGISYWKVNVDVYFEYNKNNFVSGKLQIISEFSNSITHTITVKPNAYGELVYNTSFLVDKVSSLLYDFSFGHKTVIALFIFQ